MELTIGQACLGSDGNDWVYTGLVASNPDGSYYRFARCIMPEETELLFTHHNGVEVGTGCSGIKGIKA